MMNRQFDYVRYASGLFIKRYESKQGSQPTGVLYNKFMTLLNRELKNKLGENMGLPHCWYRWGDEVVRHDMPYLVWNHDNPRQTLVTFSGQVLDSPSRDDMSTFISSFADSFIARYGGDEGFEMAIDEVYSEAPFEFQNDYRVLRENLKQARSNVPLSNHTDLVRGLYAKAMSAYPMESFESTRIQKEQFRKVFDQALDEGLTADRLQQISETFWFYFCYHLRLHRDCHENVSAETLRIWREALPEAGEVYEEKMQNYAYYLFPYGSDDPVINGLLEDRKERLDELGSIMAEMGCGEGS